MTLFRDFNFSTLPANFACKNFQSMKFFRYMTAERGWPEVPNPPLLVPTALLGGHGLVRTVLIKTLFYHLQQCYQLFAIWKYYSTPFICVYIQVVLTLNSPSSKVLTALKCTAKSMQSLHSVWILPRIVTLLEFITWFEGILVNLGFLALSLDHSSKWSDTELRTPTW